MAFNRKLTSGIGVTPVLVSNVVPAGKTHTVHGLSIANTSVSPITVTATITDGVLVTNLVKNISIPIGDTLSLMGMDYKHNLIAGDSISVSSSTAASVDVLYSYLEQ